VRVADLDRPRGTAVGAAVRRTHTLVVDGNVVAVGPRACSGRGRLREEREAQSGEGQSGGDGEAKRGSHEISFPRGAPSVDPSDDGTWEAVHFSLRHRVGKSGHAEEAGEPWRRGPGPSGSRAASCAPPVCPLPPPRDTILRPVSARLRPL